MALFIASCLNTPNSVKQCYIPPYIAFKMSKAVFRDCIAVSCTRCPAGRYTLEVGSKLVKCPPIS